MADSHTVQVVFTPSGKRGDIKAGKSVLEAAQQLGVDLDTVCGGRGICDRCQIDHSVGEFAKFNEFLWRCFSDCRENNSELIVHRYLQTCSAEICIIVLRILRAAVSAKTEIFT